MGHYFQIQSIILLAAMSATCSARDAESDLAKAERAPEPAKTRGLRLAQMRQLSRYFDASSRADDVARPLRPLNQPLYRFDTKKIDDDGAIFGYVTGTDPELLVAILTLQTKDGPKWHFGAGRFSDLPLELKFKNKTVWQFGDRVSYDGGYVSQHGIDFRPRMPNLRADSE